MHLIRIFRETAQRVDLSVHLLNRHAAFLLVDEDHKRLFGWIGELCAEEDRVLMVALSLTIFRHDLNQQSTDFPIYRENSTSLGASEIMLDCLGARTVDTAELRTKSSYIDEPINHDRRLCECVEAPNGTLHLKRIQTVQRDARGSVGKLTAASMSPTRIYVVDCGPCVWLWHGSSVPDTRQKESMALANELACEVTGDTDQQAELITAGLEPTVFSEMFRAKMPKREIVDEVERITGVDIGTVAMLKDSIGDAFLGLSLDLLDNSRAQLYVYKLTDAPELLQNDAIGIFVSTYAYILKFVTVDTTVLYAWIGRDCPPSTPSTISRHMVQLARGSEANRKHQATILQGKEPPLFLAMLRSVGAPFVVVDGNNAPSDGVLTRVIEVAGMDTMMAAEVPIGIERSSDYIHAHGIHPYKSYVVIQANPTSAVGKLWIRLGKQANTLTNQTAREITASASALLRAAGDIGATIAIELQQQELDQGTETEEFFEALGIDADLVVDANYGNLTRPRRLFQISEAERMAGGPFLEEIGPGGTFSQSDLQPSASYLLETGRSMLFVWHGPSTLYKAMALATRVCRVYVQMEGAAYPQVASAKVVHVMSGAEPANFVACFRQWNRKLQRASVQAVLFDPANIPDDEKKDDGFDDLGRPRSVRDRVKYFENSAAEIAKSKSRSEIRSSISRQGSSKTSTGAVESTSPRLNGTAMPSSHSSEAEEKDSKDRNSLDSTSTAKGTSMTFWDFCGFVCGCIDEEEFEAREYKVVPPKTS